jgi:hypothetical protein
MIHDSDSSNHKRHSCDCAKQKRHYARSRGGCLGDFLLVTHGEVVVASGTDVVPLPKQGNDLLLSRLELLWITDLHIDIAKSCAADDALHRAR